MMDLLTTVMMSWLMLVMGLLALASSELRGWRNARRRVRAERVRSAFAEARNEVVRLAATGALSPDSATFQTLYFVNTAVMRRDDQYDQMWPAFLGSISTVNDPERIRPIQAEARTWSEPVAAAAFKSSQAIEIMLVEHSLLMRGVFRLTGGLLPYARIVRRQHEREHQRKLRVVHQWTEEFETRHDPDRRAVRQFQQVLRREPTPAVC